MKDLEEKIIEAAQRFGDSGCSSIGRKLTFIEGALSSEAKDLWQQGMYSEEDMINMASKAFNLGVQRETLTSGWFNQNKKKS